jgi:hypothetical protein
MDAALSALAEESCVRLDATPLGEPMYRRYGFRPECELLRLRGTAAMERLDGSSGPARPIQPDDLASVYNRDRDVFGADRSSLLDSFYRRAPEFAWLVSHGSAVRGYCFGRTGHLYNHIGPIVADNLAIARELVSHCVAGYPGRTFALDTPREAPEWTSWLQSAGFAVERPFLRMCRGETWTLGVPGMQFAIAGPEFG